MNYLLNVVHKLITAFVVCLFIMCCNKQAVPVINEPVQPVSSDIIKLRLENQREDGFTKVAIDGSSGGATWTSGDQIAYCVSNGVSTYYITESVNITNADIAMNAPSGFNRVNYAVYPAVSQGVDFTTPTVVYPSSYNLSGKETETYTPMPMVANNTLDELNFYHVGGCLRLKLTEVDAATSKVTVRFNGISDVCGTYTVSNPGTDNATTTLSSGAGNIVTFTNVPVSNGLAWINCPLPCVDLSALTSITINTYNSGDIQLQTIIKKFRWSNVDRAVARKYTVSFSGAFETFGGLMIAPAPLYYDGTTFIIKDDDWNHGSYNSTQGLTTGSYYFQRSDLVYFHSGGYVSSYDSIDNNGSRISYGLYDDWRLPTQSDVNKILTTDASVRPGSTVNGQVNKHYAKVQLSGVSGPTGSNPYGLIIFPDNESFSLKANSVSINTFDTYNAGFSSGMTLSELQDALDHGCVFLPATGCYYNSSWQNPSYGYYGTTNVQTYYSSGTFKRVSFFWGFHDTYVGSIDLGSSSGQSIAVPVRLVRDAD